MKYFAESRDIKAQVCFSGDADLEKVEEQLKELSEKEYFEFYCCFLNRDMVEDKGFDTDIIDLLDKVLGDNLTYMADEYDDFDDYMDNIVEVRTKTANMVYRMFVLDSGTADGVKQEIKLFTNQKVVMM